MLKAILVDNNPRTRGLLGELLTHTLNVDTKSFDFVHINIQIIKYFKPNILFIDQPYPDLSGFELIKNIRNDEELCDIPIIVMFSVINKEFLNIIAKFGIAAILKKPYNKQLILNQITNRLNKITVDENSLIVGSQFSEFDINISKIINDIPNVINNIFIHNYNNRVQFDFSNFNLSMENAISIKNIYKSVDNKLISTSLIATFKTIERLLSNMDEKDAIDVFINKSNTLFEDLNINIIKLFLFDGYEIIKTRHDSSYMRKLDFSKKDYNFFFKNEFEERFCFSISLFNEKGSPNK